MDCTFILRCCVQHELAAILLEVVPSMLLVLIGCKVSYTHFGGFYDFTQAVSQRQQFLMSPHIVHVDIYRSVQWYRWICSGSTEHCAAAAVLWYRTVQSASFDQTYQKWVITTSSRDLRRQRRAKSCRVTESNDYDAIIGNNEQIWPISENSARTRKRPAHPPNLPAVNQHRLIPGCCL